MKTKNLKPLIAALLVLAVLLGAALFAYAKLSPKAVEGEKTISVSVIHSDGSEKSFTLLTKAETLGDALREAELVDGDMGSYGMYVTLADGELADWDENESWWCFTQSGVFMNTGVDSTMIRDGDEYEITYTIGYSEGGAVG